MKFYFQFVEMNSSVALDFASTSFKEWPHQSKFRKKSTEVRKKDQNVILRLTMKSN